MNSSVEKLVKNISDNDYKYLSQEFNPEQLKLAKQKWMYPYEYMFCFERFSEDKLPDKNIFIGLWKKHISVKNTICMLSKFVIALKRKNWVIIMTFI